jgi:hypothetical protein
MLINGQAVPTDWKDYPYSFLVAAVPIYHEEGTFPKTWHKLAMLGYTHILKLGGCPIIKEFNPVKKDSTRVDYTYKIQGSPALIYKVFVSLLDAEGNILETKFGSGLEEPGDTMRVKDKGEVAAIRLTVKPWDADKIVDSKTVTFKLRQASLF